MNEEHRTPIEDDGIDAAWDPADAATPKPVDEADADRAAPSKQKGGGRRKADADPGGDADAEDQGGLDEACPDLPLTGRVEALLLAADRPVTEARLGAILGLRGKGVAKRIEEAIEALNAEYEKTGRMFRARRLAGGWQFLTEPVLGPLLGRMQKDRQQSRLSPAAMETLSIIAYRQPVIRAEIEAIRGVSCGEVLRGLMERRLVKIVGRAEELGRPMLYGTTREFLKAFGLSSLDDLPEVDDDRSKHENRPKPAAEKPQDADQSQTATRHEETRDEANEGEAKESEA